MELVPSASGTTDYMLAPLPDALDKTPDFEDGERLNRLYGAPVSWRDHCITCHGNKTFKTRLGDQIVTVTCDCRGQWILDRWMKVFNIRRSHAQLSWHHVETVPQDVITKVKRYADNIVACLDLGLGLTLWSERRGTGKTMLTVLALKQAMTFGKSVYFTTYLDLMEAFSRTWSSPEEDAWFRRRIDRADAIALDDMGKERAAETDARYKTIAVDGLNERILRNRVADNRTILVSSNLDPAKEEGLDGFARYLKDVIELFSEVNEIVEVGGTSFRRVQQERKLADAEAGVVYPVVLR